MKEYIKYEVFDDHWCFRPKADIDLSELRKLNFTDYKQIEDIEIRIETSEDKNHPNNAQIDILEEILENQNVIIKAIFNYYEKVILPVFQDATDIYEDEIANDSSELYKVLGTVAIEIPEIYENDFNCFVIQFNFKYDSEHGLYILFKDLNAIDFFGIGDLSYDSVGLFNDELKVEKPLKFNLYHLNGETVFQKTYKYDERINFELAKGTYRAFITWNDSELCRNFYVPENINSFSMREILTKIE